MSSLNLPAEVIIRLLSYLSPKELAPCARVSKQFLTIIKTSSLLTYALELGKAGLEETYFFSFDQIENSECKPSDLLAALRKRELAWSTFGWNKHVEIPLKKRYAGLEVCGHIFTGGYAQYTREDEIDTIDVYDFHNPQKSGPMTSLTLNGLYSHHAIDPGQDLLVLIESYTGVPFCKLHFRTLSTGLEYDYTEIKQPTLSLRRFGHHRNRRVYRVLLHIFGDYLLFTQCTPELSDVKIINWKTAQYLSVYSGNNPLYSTMISETEILLLGYGEDIVPSLIYYTVDPHDPNSRRLEEEDPLDKSDDNSFKIINRVIFKLPFKNHRRSPRVKEWHPGMIMAEATFTAKLFSPFVNPSAFLYPPKPKLIGIKVQHDDRRLVHMPPDSENSRPHTLDIFIDLESLRKLKEKLSPTMKTVPWRDWGPDITRVFDNRYPAGWDRRCLRGYRVLSPDLPEYRILNGQGKLDAVILDFNAATWTPSTPGVIRDRTEISAQYNNGIKINIASSLPYRKITIPDSETKLNKFGIKVVDPFLLLGDNIICFDLNNWDVLISLNVFQF